MLTEEQAQTLRKYLKARKILLKDFAVSLGITPNSLRRYLNQQVPPSLPIRKLIYHLTGIKLEN